MRARAGRRRPAWEEALMRRRLTLASTFVAILLIFVLPVSTVSAATYTYNVKSNQCSPVGGGSGYGHMYFKVRLQEYGWSGANKFTFAGKVQHKNLGGHTWRTDWNAGTFTYYFADNDDSNWYTRWWSYDPNDLAWHRFVITLKVWHNGSPLASRTLYGKVC
jgi:hypothetical protein